MSFFIVINSASYPIKDMFGYIMRGMKFKYQESSCGRKTIFVVDKHWNIELEQTTITKKPIKKPKTWMKMRANDKRNTAVKKPTTVTKYFILLNKKPPKLPITKPLFFALLNTGWFVLNKS